MKKLLLALAMTLCFAAPLQAAEEYTVQSFWSSAHKLNKVLWEPWCDEINAKFKDEVVFHFYPLNSLVKMDAMPSSVKSGSLDIGGLQLQSAIAMMPHSQAIALPFLVQNAKESCTLYPKMFEAFPEMRAEVEKNFKFLAAFGSDRSALAAKDGLIKSPADLKGKRVLVWAPYQSDEVTSWGGIPVQVVPAETYMGIQRGLGDVAYIPYPAVEVNKISEVAHYITLIPSRSMPLVIVMNKDSWDSLPRELQQHIDETTGTKMSDFIGDELLRLTDEDIAKQKAKGCQVHILSIEEQRPFKELAAEVNRQYWVNMLSRHGVQDPEGWMARVENLAAETFGR